jgi:hypothetical protein
MALRFLGPNHPPNHESRGQPQQSHPELSPSCRRAPGASHFDLQEAGEAGKTPS